ncbi:MAG: hypothetical protein DHS20C08_14120 [Rhodomicrobium sp.]|nr:MAG: hypothetical protein DHS20C08_14120 [Rhodomicrobium sp.]
MSKVTLYKFGNAYGIPDPSSFVLKLETFLRLAKIDYEAVAGDVRKSPKAKFPSIKLNDQFIGDSEICIAALGKEFGVNLNEGLSAKTLADHRALRLALENHTYFLMIYYRWLTPNNAALMRETFFSSLGVMGRVIFAMVQKGYKRTLYGQGILRYTEAEKEELIAGDVKMLSDSLGDAPFFGGESPREIDCTTFGIIANLLLPEMEGQLARYASADERLVAYNNRMTELTFPDYKDTMIRNGS